MSFNSKTCLDQFYTAMTKPPFDFQYHCQNTFFPELKKSFLKGGPYKSTRKKVIQEAIDAMQVYGKLSPKAAAGMRYTFETTYRSFFTSHLPANTPSAAVQATKMELIDAKYYVLTEKFLLLDYWQAVAAGTTEPNYPDDGGHWAMHELMQFDPVKVRPILEILLADAAIVLKKQHFTTEMSLWKGADYQVKKSYTKTGMAKTLCFDASARAGMEMKGQLDMQYSGLKVHADAELFAGARGRVQGNVNVSQSGFSAKGKVEAELGIHFKTNVSCDVFDVLEAGIEIDALAGALASAEAEFTIDYNGVKVKVGAEAFAGVKVTAAAHGTLKLGGREITKAKVTATAMAGIGGSAGAHFECSLFGNVSFGAKAGAVMGVGASVDTAISIDFHNIHWGAANLFWTYVNEHGFKNKGKIWFLPVKENVEMCLLARQALFKMMGDLYAENESELALLERWKMIERNVPRKLNNPHLSIV
ncbi:MAG: hypothetical protein ABJK37_04565 [Paraglaciecola sp.]|uniref:hypothetical protein n=1 Tax=Paraglaciecola sp. TaxID=1920173 RepID=UPI0032996948